MKQINLKEQVDAFVTCIDDMMLISEQMYHDKQYSNHRDYNDHKDLYMEKRELMKETLFDLITNIKASQTQQTIRTFDY